jgi:hypothetical protein
MIQRKGGIRQKGQNLQKGRGLWTGLTELGLGLENQAGTSDPDSLASKLADSSVSESPPLCASARVLFCTILLEMRCEINIAKFGIFRKYATQIYGSLAFFKRA